MVAILPISLVAVIRELDQNRFEVWMQKRSEDGPLDQLWEFPGGKWDVGESPEDAARREFKEEVGVALEKLLVFKSFVFEYTDRKVSLRVFLANGNELALPSSNRQQWKNIRFEEPLEALDEIPAANKDIIMSLSSYLAEEGTQRDWETFWE